MAVIDVVNSKGEKVSERELSDELFNVAVKTSVLHEVVTAQLAGRRSGTASTKRRSRSPGKHTQTLPTERHRSGAPRRY